MNCLRNYLLAVFLLCSVPVSHATDSFQGSIWSLSYSGSSLPDADPAHETYRIALGVDLAGYIGGGSFLDEVALKVSNSVFAASLFSAPGGASAWTLQPGGINASGCGGSGGGFECADSNFVLNNGHGVTASDLNAGDDYQWVFDITVNNGTNLLTSIGASSIKARFVDGAGNKVGALVSEPITLSSFFVSSIPEPESYALMLSGLGMLVIALRRRPMS